MSGSCYILPPDSEYYSHDSFASIQEKLKIIECNEFCVSGDLNARFGTTIREFVRHTEALNQEKVFYPVLPDDVRVPSENPFTLLNICKKEKG